MKNHLFLFLVLFAAGFYSPCAAQENVSREIVVAGKIDNYDPADPVELFVNRLGFLNEAPKVDVDSEGNFRASFKSYIPLDAWVTYRTNFLVLLHPGDSLYVRFDGSAPDRPELLSTIGFGGDGAEINRSAARFQQMYFANPVYADWNAKSRAVKEYSPEQYLKYADAERAKGKAIYDRFVVENNPDETVKKWAALFLDEDHYRKIALYPSGHASANNISWRDTIVTFPPGFARSMEQALPLDPENLIATYALNGLANNYSFYVYDRMRDDRSEDETRWAIMPTGGMIAGSDIADSLTIYNIVKYVSDPLLKEIMLADEFNGNFKTQNIAAFEKYRDFVNEHITQPYLVEPLYEKYMETKFRLENPELHTEAIIKEASTTAAGQLFNDILKANKGKVIYIDFWATWCGPCLGEMPNSKKVEEALHGRDVAFVYICLESDRDKALATVSNFQLSGQHHILNVQQSREIRDLFDINGIPFYILIDKNGTIIDKGSHLRPGATQHKIESML